MAIQTRPEHRQSNVIHIVMAAGAAAAIAVAAIVPFARSSSPSSEGTWNVGPSFVSEVNANQRLGEEMAVHEALSEAQFGPLAVSGAAVAAQAIAEHDASFPRLVRETSVSSPDTAAEVARALAEHDALIEPFLLVASTPARDHSAEVARVIAEHDALIEPFVS